MTFTIQYPVGKKAKSNFCRRFGLNAYYAGKPWQVRKWDANDLHLMAISAMRRAKIPKKLFERPVEVKFYWDDGLDVDNHAIIGKCVVDAMKGYVLHDDRRKWLKGGISRDVGRRVHPGGNFGIGRGGGMKLNGPGPACGPARLRNSRLL